MNKSFERNPKKIAKNTMYLYIRMLLLLVISLYTSRLVLKELGITDYGLYNVIGGLITIFSFINGSMAQASQRFITYEVGIDSPANISRTFSTCVYVHIALAGLIVLLGETVGLWYVCNVAVIPSDRFYASLWIYQCSIVVACATVITVPYNALIVAYERMSAFAYLTIIEALLKLAIVGAIIILPFDRLISYGVLMAVLSISMRVMYGIYSRHAFPYIHFERRIDKSYIKSMGSFAGWSMCGSIAAAGYSQGLNLLINFFFNPAVNAARGLAVTVQSVIRNFSNNFQIAVNPQITKSYAAGDLDYLYLLVYKASLFSFFLYFIIALPVFLEIEMLLSIWLIKVPEYTAIFIRILILISAVEVLSSPLNVTAQATGKIKYYELLTSIILLCIVPFSYCVLKTWPHPANVFYVFLIQMLIALIVRLYIVHRLTSISIKTYLIKVIFRILLTSLIAMIIPVAVHYMIDDKWYRLVTVVAVSVTFTPCAVFLLGLNKTEQSMVVCRLKRIIK